MKKVLSILLVVMLVAGLSVSALAADSPAVDEPRQTGPIVNGGIPVNVALPVVPDGATTDPFMADATDAAIKAAVAAIQGKSAEDLAKALPGLEAGVTAVKADRVFGTAGEESVTKQIVVPATFAGLFGFADGAWAKVDVEVIEEREDGSKVIEFTAVPGTVYCIALNATPSAATGESVPYALLIAALVLAAGAVVFFRKSRKANA